MLVTDPVFLIVVIFGIWTSYTDIKYGKIKNISILLLLLSGLAINIFFTRSLIDSTFDILINSLIAFSVGFLLWSFNLWSPADVKLFSAFSLLIPFSIYEMGFVKYFPSYIILVNTFVPVAVFFILYSMIKMDVGFLKKEVKKTFRISVILNSFVFILGLSSISLLVYKFFGIKLNLLLQIILLLVILKISEKFKKFSIRNFLVIMLVLSAIFSFKEFFTLSFLRSSLIFFIAFQILRLLISYLDIFSFTKEVQIRNLKAGMSLGEYIVKKGGKYEKEPSYIITYFDVLRNVKKRASSRFTGKLTEKDIKKFKEIDKKKKLGFKTVKIVKTLPFAPFM